jgi:hypothetical protein
MVNHMGNLLTLIIQDKESKIFSMDYSEGICHLLFRFSILSKPKQMVSSRLNRTQCLEVLTIFSIFSESLLPQVKANPSQLSIFLVGTRSLFSEEPSWSKIFLIK